MENWLSRAMQVSLLEEKQIKELQATEQTKGTYLANWNIQELFHLPEIREAYDIPEDTELQAIHSNRIRKEVKERILPHIEKGLSGLEYLHALDWAVFALKNTVIWPYAAGSKSKRFESALKGLKCLLI